MTDVFRSQTFKKLITLFKMIGATYVMDTSFTTDVVLEEVAAEFVGRLHHDAGAGPLPLLVSECPGWVCYAEKTQAHALPYLSAVKSGMEAMAALVRSPLLPRPAGSERAPLFHAAVMPCFDKKLEASRDDFALRGKEDAPGARDVDTVLATTEVLEVLEKAAPGTSFADLAETEPLPSVCPFANYDAAAGAGGALFGAPHAAAGGYLEHAMRAACRASGSPAAEAAAGGEIRFAPATSSAARNADYCEAAIEGCSGASGSGSGAPKCAFAYGFRNIQNVMRKLKSRTCAYQLVEVVACPQACLNGGGQMKPPKGVTREQWADRVRSRFEERVARDPRENAQAAKVRAELGSAALRTQYHFREDKVKNPLAIQW